MAGDRLPPGIIKAKSSKSPYQARIFYQQVDDKKATPRSIGSFATLAEAVTALAEATAKFTAGGAAAVWGDKSKAVRAERGKVRAAPEDRSMILACAYAHIHPITVHRERRNMCLSAQRTARSRHGSEADPRRPR